MYYIFPWHGHDPGSLVFVSIKSFVFFKVNVSVKSIYIERSADTQNQNEYVAETKSDFLIRSFKARVAHSTRPCLSYTTSWNPTIYGGEPSNRKCLGLRLF